MTEDDFDAILPLPYDLEDLDSGFSVSPPRLSPCPYHVAICQVALINHQFNRSLRQRPDDLKELVRAADVGLARLVEALPSHLQPHSGVDVGTGVSMDAGTGLGMGSGVAVSDSFPNDGISGLSHLHNHPTPDLPTSPNGPCVGTSPTPASLATLEAEYPWLHWQRVELLTILNLTRARINHTCRKYWDLTPPQCLAQRDVCLAAARDVVGAFGGMRRKDRGKRFLYVFSGPCARLCLFLLFLT